MHVELVRTVTRDGLRLDGALLEPHNRNASFANANANQPTAAILLHGVAGNFYTSSTFEPLVGRLQALGIAPLLVNTRGHDSVFGASLGNVRRRFGAAYETVDDCRQDIAAWLRFLTSRGHPQILLIGHSLGAIKAVYAQANDKHPEVAAVVAVSGPRLSYSAFMNAPESSLFWESMHTAEELAAAGRGEDLFTSKYPFPLLITAAAYIDKYGKAERYNLLKFAADLPCPALFTYGSKELATGGIAFAGLVEALAALPNAERRTVATIDGADHLYTGVADALATRICDWLSGLKSAAGPGGK
jgi:pimeloyl-ACP methyl ester carboxylesterase